jgi:glycosyltransferase involved in cell wall biosynthesis
MIQNMEPFAENIDGDSFTDKCRLYIQYILAKKAIKKATRVIAISKYVEEFLVHRWNIPEEKIGLVYHGIELPQLKEYIRPKNIPKDWEGNFLFTAGSIRPARGLEDVLWAMNHLILEKVDIKGLVIAGDVSPSMISHQHRLKKWIQAQNLSSKIYWVGSLNEKEMNWCYRNCKMFVMTSRVESFGMIAGEAMAQGCVCISSDSPCLPEIFGDAAIYYPPKNGKLLAEVIKSVTEWDNYQLDETSKKAREQASKFSWDITVERLLTEFKKTIESLN